MGILLIVALAAATGANDYSHFRVSAAQQNRITSAEYRRCSSRAIHNEEAVQCIRDERGRLDQLLNVKYRAAMAKMLNQHQHLRATERQWLQDSEQECFNEMHLVGHTPYELALHQCQIDGLIRRIAWLDKLRRN